jgi:serine protease AprX
VPPSHLLPIKTVLAIKERDYRLDKGGGSSKELHQTVTPELRRKLASSIDNVAEHFKESFQAYPDIPAVAKVALFPKATAKTHRPKELFNESTCPIIGGDEAGELFVGVDQDGLSRLKRDIKSRNKKLVANISTLIGIAPYDANDTLTEETSERLLTAAAKLNAPLRLRLFRHPSEHVNATIDRVAESLVVASGADSLDKLDYGDGVRVYAIRGATTQTVQTAARFAGTQSLSLFPSFNLVRQASHIIGKMDDSRFPLPDPEMEMGIVGLIDSGTDPNNQRLQAYVVDRVDWIPRTDQDNEHGSFVGGLIANARALNHGDSSFPSSRSSIVDVVAIGKDSEISEYDLITVVETAVKRFPNVRVWNLSLSQKTPCKDNRFSLLACKLDSIARKRGVLFVIAAGNYETPPFRDWKPTSDIGEDDRICPPADSVRGLTVGSVAHIDNSATCVKAGDPSPFTRRGPAAHFYMKPELSHYGGNCNPQGGFLQSGVISLDACGNVAENVGTSFAAPNVATLAANIFHELGNDSSLSPTLVKALLVHSAFVRSGRPDPDDVRYRGLGLPGEVTDILNCDQSSATIIFHANLSSREIFEKQEFPMPLCLQVPDIGLRAEVFMTLAYDPPTDARFGIEYCRRNVTASLGTLNVDEETGKEVYAPQMTPVPKGATKGLEERLVKEGHKWSPVKLYHREFTRGPLRKKWRLHLEVLDRLGYRSDMPQPVVLLVTIRDPLGRAFVYNGIVREMNRLAWGAQDLTIKSRVR